MTRNVTEDERDERKTYTLGLVLSVGMTVLSFGMVMSQAVPRTVAIPAIIVLALAQIVVHLRIFLHINLSRQRREDLQLLLFTVLLLAIMALGTLWIMNDLSQRMI